VTVSQPGARASRSSALHPRRTGCVDEARSKMSSALIMPVLRTESIESGRNITEENHRVSILSSLRFLLFYSHHYSR